MAKTELNSGSQGEGFDPKGWASAKISHSTRKDPFYGFESAEALENCLNKIVLPRLQSMQSASYKVFAGVERFAVVAGEDGILELRVEPNRQMLPGLRKGAFTANACLTIVMASLPKSLRSIFGDRVSIDNSPVKIEELQVTEGAFFQEGFKEAARSKILNLSVKPGEIRFYRIAFGDKDSKVSLDPNAQAPINRKINERSGIESSDTIKTYTIVDIDIEYGFLYEEQAKRIINELESEFKHIENLVVRFPQEALKVDETIFLEERSHLVDGDHWRSELLKSGRVPSGNIRGLRRLARVRRGSFPDSGQDWLRSKYDLQKIYDLRGLPLVAKDDPARKIKKTAGSRGSEDAVCYFQVENCIYQLVVFPLREYPSEFGFRGVPPAAFYPGKNTLAIFNGRLINPDGTTGRQNSNLGLVAIQHFMSQGAGDTYHDSRVERMLALGREAQRLQKENERRVLGKLHDITVSNAEELDVGRAISFANEGLTQEFVGSAIPLKLRCLADVSEEDPLFWKLAVEFPGLYSGSLSSENYVFALIDALDDKLLQATRTDEIEWLSSMREELSAHSSFKPYRAVQIKRDGASILPGVARFKRGENQRQLLALLESRAAVSNGQRKRVTRPYTIQDLERIIRRSNVHDKKESA